MWKRILGYINSSVFVLGFLVMIMGVINVGRLILGRGKIPAGDKNKLGLKYMGVNLNLETSGAFFAVAVGVIMVISSMVISSSFPVGEFAEAMNLIRNIPIVQSEVKEGGYKVSREDIKIDLRTRKEIGPLGFTKGAVSKTKWLINRVIKETEDDLKEMNFRHATTGPGIIPLAKQEGAELVQIEKESKAEVVNPFTEFFEGKKKLKEVFKNLLARKGRMTSYYMVIPVTEEKNQTIRYQLQYLNAFQGTDFEWAGKLFSADTDVLTMNIVFPEEKPFKKLWVYKKPLEALEKVAVENPDVQTMLDNHGLKWTIRNAKKGEKYFIKWEW